jgi:hypothetical protein
MCILKHLERQIYWKKKIRDTLSPAVLIECLGHICISYPFSNIFRKNCFSIYLCVYACGCVYFDGMQIWTQGLKLEPHLYLFFLLWFIVFFCLGWLGSQSSYFHLPQSWPNMCANTPSLFFCWDEVLLTFLPWLVSNCDLPDLHLPSNWNNAWVLWPVFYKCLAIICEHLVGFKLSFCNITKMTA